MNPGTASDGGRAACARGFTIVELAIAPTLFLVLFGAAVIALLGDRRAERVITAQLGPEMRARHALERLSTELRMAGVRGEDRNDNGDLDDGEDVNGNGRLDSDWNLPDGATGQEELTFNRRIDMVDPEGVGSSGVYSSPVRYFLERGSLVRAWTRTDGETGESRELTHVVAQGISGLRFARTGSVVTIALDLKLPPGVYRDDSRTLSTSVWLRN